eukprot:1183260-Prorocentrum_minimum.AAC.2
MAVTVAQVRRIDWLRNALVRFAPLGFCFVKPLPALAGKPTLILHVMIGVKCGSESSEPLDVLLRDRVCWTSTTGKELSSLGPPLIGELCRKH